MAEPRRPTHDAGDVARLLAERIDALARQLLPGGRRDGRAWRCGSLAGEAGQSLVVQLDGGKRGCWFEFNGHFGGNALDLVARCRCGGDLEAGIRWAREWLGLGELSDAEYRAQRERAERAAQHREAAHATQREQKRQAAKRLWLAGAMLHPGDVVCRYLAGRGIDLARLKRLPNALRTHPGLWHKAGGAWPAMVAAISGPDGAHLATQRTWLAVRSNGEVTKAPLGHDAKMSLGSFRDGGGAIHLTRGASGKPWRAAGPGEPVAFAEGIEDALTFATIRPDIRVAACATSLAYLAHVALPPGCGEVIVVAQNDARGSDAMAAQANGLAGLRAKGVAVSVFRPPVFVKDLNDYAQWLGAAPAEPQPQ